MTPVEDDDRVYLAAGEIVAKKYRVDRILGVGGVGFVVAATHVELGGLFALKFLKRRFLHDKTIGERFTHEARVACRISSEFVARVYDVGSHDGAPFIVLEHLVGRDLSAVLNERGALGLRESAEYGVQACAALAVAHANGIVHLDIKPDNLFVVDEQGLPTLKLLDFGISKFVRASGLHNEWAGEQEPITGALGICGTPAYMSPEQIRSTSGLDARSDVWSLGVVLYELMASAPAFQAESVVEVCSAILETEPRRLDEVRPEVPPGFADVVSRCLQKSPADRFASVAELAIALLPFATGRALAIAENSEWIRRAAIQTVGGVGTDAPVSSRAPNSTSGIRPRLPTDVSAATPVVAPGPVVAPAPRRRWLGVGAAVAMSVVAMGAYQWIARGRHAAEGEGTASGIAASSPQPGPDPTVGRGDQSPAAPDPSSVATPVGSSVAPIRAAMPWDARAPRTMVRAPASRPAFPPSSVNAAAPGTVATPVSPDARPPAWEAVTAPPARTARAIDSSNPWSK